ncbi:PhzF family phenazine biosynthesis protein [Actinokineospora sp. HUAS TT18]|uniref:PhzF family phenazine biosynthesis protein n=1 Tax=Actinokineospora sp. HUAS TT18 TaxID=3447451 RepID=UPI003F51FEEF
MRIQRYTAFSGDPDGGNPAGVVLDASGASDSEMLAVAADLGYSETAFLVPRGPGAVDVRYFSPLAEVPFCGHATIAAAVAYARTHGVGPVAFHTSVGLVEVTTVEAGEITATLVSVPPKSVEIGDPAELLAALRYSPEDLDPSLPVRVAYAGAWHPIVAVRSRELLAALDYDYDALSALTAARAWTTVDVVWRESASVYWARNPFPPGGVVEDPATGAAAAAFGGYLRELGQAPSTVTVHQGDDLGRPGVITVGIPAEPGTGISVSGTAVVISDPSGSAE